MSDELCPVRLSALSQDLRGIDTVVLTDERGRHLPMLVHECEAIAIRFTVQGVERPPRPLTHDLLLSSIERLGGTVTALWIDDLWQDTFYAKLCVTSAQGEELQIDCRPSDGLALALRAGVPVLVRDDVMEEGKVELPLAADPDAEDDADDASP